MPPTVVRCSYLRRNTMQVLISPKVGLAGYLGSSLVGGRDFVLVEPEEGTIKPKIMTGKYEIFGNYKFPDTASTEQFNQVLTSVAQGYDSDKDGDFQDWYINKVHLAAEAYLSELQPTDAAEKEPKKAKAKKVAE